MTNKAYDVMLATNKYFLERHEADLRIAKDYALKALNGDKGAGTQARDRQSSAQTWMDAAELVIQFHDANKT